MTAILGYARVSTTGQDLASRLSALTAAGVETERIFTDKLSGSVKTERPGLAGLLDHARPGDVIVVAAIDRLGRSVAEVIRTIADLGERGILLRALREGTDTATPTGRAVPAIMATLAELELELGRERRAASRESRLARKLLPLSRRNSMPNAKTSYFGWPPPENPYPSGPSPSGSAGRRRTATYRRRSSPYMRSVQSFAMLVTDLRHFLDLPEDTPVPARRLALHLGNIVRAGTAGAVGTPWMTALPCRRRPAHRPCRGRMTVSRTELAAPIRWQCSVCDDEGVISNWADSPYDLRRRRLTVAGAVNELIIDDEIAVALRDLQLLDPDCERLVFGMRAHPNGAVLPATDDDLDELIGFVAAEANHEPNRRRQRRLDVAFTVLTAADQEPAGH